MENSEAIENIKEIASTLKVLYVEDEAVTRMMNKKKFDSIFKEVVSAEDGALGLEAFKASQYDLIITDNIMPNMDGIDMIREIRKTDTKIPIIITTAFIDIAYLISAINLNVTQFISKPIEMEMLLKAISVAIQRVVLENLAHKTKEQELELLRYQEKYHSSQQENALRKELNLIENSFLFKRLDIKNSDGVDNTWLINFTYEPLEILSGDSYSIRDLGNGKALFFIIDGMGKGLSASVTTTLSVAHTNFLIDTLVKDGKECNLRELIMDYVKFISKMLLDEEIVSNTYCLVDFINETIEVAIFSLPPVHFQKNSGEIFSIKSNNMPVTKYTFDVKTEVVSIKDVFKIMIFSDGLNECFTIDGEIYNEHLEKDFGESVFMKNMITTFNSKVNNKDDDLTLFYLFRMPEMAVSEKVLKSSTKIDEVSDISVTVEEYLTEIGLDESFAITYMTTFTEMIMNAYEHGNLGITNSQKTRLIKSGEYDDFMAEKEKSCDKSITVTLEVYQVMGKRILCTYIADEGKGFDTKLLEKLLVSNIENLSENGRGVLMSRGFSDELLYNLNANEVLFINLI